MGCRGGCQLLCGAPPRLVEARLVDLSSGGAGLLVPAPLADESVVAVQLAGGPFVSARALVARVTHCDPADGDYLVGVEFERRLSADEVRLLIS